MFSKTIQTIKTFFVPNPQNGFMPHALRTRTIVLYVLIAVFIKSVSLLSGLTLPATRFFADVTSQLVITLSNNERVGQGLQPLAENAILDNAAMQKAQDMIANKYFAHNSPQGVDPWYWFRKSGYQYTYAGENLAIDFFESSDVVQAWKNSPSHWENLVNQNYKDIGVAVVRGAIEGYETTVVVQLFGSPKATKPATQLNISPKPSVRPSPSVSPIAYMSPAATPVPSVEGSAIVQPVQQIVATPTSQTTISHKIVRTVPTLISSMVDTVMNPTIILGAFLAYLLIVFALGAFSRLYAFKPQALVGMAIVIIIVTGMIALPGVKDILHTQARALPPMQTIVP